MSLVRGQPRGFCVFSAFLSLFGGASCEPPRFVAVFLINPPYRPFTKLTKAPLPPFSEFSEGASGGVFIFLEPWGGCDKQVRVAPLCSYFEALPIRMLPIPLKHPLLACPSILKGFYAVAHPP